MKGESTARLITPKWPVPAHVRAFSTTRLGGVSLPPWDSFNLGVHVGDDPHAVAANRALLRRELELPSEPCWLQQVHGHTVVNADAFAAPSIHNCSAPPDSAAHDPGLPLCTGDASMAKKAGTICVVLTADCLPVLFCDKQGTRVAAAHAGWQGLGRGVLESTVTALCADGAVSPDDLLVWLGPGIGPGAFEVGIEVRELFVQALPEASLAFRPNRPGHWLTDIYKLARQRLDAAGVRAIYGGRFCTWQDSDHFFSHRRDKGKTGRMASLIYTL